MGKLNRTCFVCGKQYHYCYSCPSDLQNPSWKNLFDVENCKNIFNILCRHGQSMIADEEARELLNRCDLSQRDGFTDNIKNHIDQIFNVVVEENINTETTKENVQNKETKKILPKRKTVEEETVE